MEKYPAGEVTKNGITVPLTVDNYGAWTADLAGTRLVADTRDKLVTKIAALTRVVVGEVEIPFSIVSMGTHSVGPSVRNGTATGFHSGNGNILATMAHPRRGATREQLQRNLAYSKPLDEQESAEFIELAHASADARAALTKFVADRRVDIAKAIRDALDKAALDMQG